MQLYASSLRLCLLFLSVSGFTSGALRPGDALLLVRVPRTGTSTFDLELNAASGFLSNTSFCQWADCGCQSYSSAFVKEGHEALHGAPCAPSHLASCFDRGKVLLLGDTPHIAVEDMGLDALLTRQQRSGNALHLLTWFRSPVARLASEYHYTRDHVGNTCSEQGGHRYAWDYTLPCGNISFAAWLADPGVQARAVNRQTRALGCYDCELVDATRRARALLPNLSWFGITERYEESMELFRCTFPEITLSLGYFVARRSSDESALSPEEKNHGHRGSRLPRYPSAQGCVGAVRRTAARLSSRFNKFTQWANCLCRSSRRKCSFTSISWTASACIYLFIALELFF